MFRYDYNVPTFEELNGESTSTSSLLSSLSRQESPATALTTLLTSEERRSRWKVKKNWLGLIVLIAAVTVAFAVFITYAVQHQDPPELEDVYPDSSDKLTVVFPEEQSRNNELPSTIITTTTASLHTKVTTSASPKTSTVVSHSGSRETATTSWTTSATAATSGGASESSSPLTTPRSSKTQVPSSSSTTAESNETKKNKKHKSLPDNYDDMDPVNLLNRMAEVADYECFRCDKDIFKVQLKLPAHNLTIGPYYGIGKKTPKKWLAAKACVSLYNIKNKFLRNDNHPEIEGENCRSESETKC